MHLSSIRANVWMQFTVKTIVSKSMDSVRLRVRACRLVWQNAWTCVWMSTIMHNAQRMLYECIHICAPGFFFNKYIIKFQFLILTKTLMKTKTIRKRINLCWALLQFIIHLDLEKELIKSQLQLWKLYLSSKASCLKCKMQVNVRFIVIDRGRFKVVLLTI